MARVLIADDSAVTRKSLCEIVTSLNHTVVGDVSNGSQAFVAYTKLKPDVVTMDLTMQGLGGAEATSKIISAYPEARIIVISAMEERRAVIDALERGARHFIIKPINRDKVAAVLNNVLKQDFDLKKHIENVRKLKKAEDQISTVNGPKQLLPPFYISAQGDNLVHIFINPNITLTSCRSLALELEEYLTDKIRVLFDFGTMVTLDQAILIKLNELVEIIQDCSGIVKAVSGNKHFVEAIDKVEFENSENILGSLVRYFPS
jgi:DNA-binding NarL/FixJ family response regulator